MNPRRGARGGNCGSRLERHRAGARMLIVLIGLGLGGTAAGADREGNYAVWGAGGKSCHAYNKASAAGEMDTWRSYVMGYFTAYNAIIEDTYSISADMDLDAVISWLDDYCDMKPVHSFEQALTGFIVEHAENRMQRPPGTYGR